MPRRNRVDPFGDLHSVASRGMFTGNRGCLVDDEGHLVHHHRGDLWIVCVTSFKGWRSPLAQPRHWTPIFFLDDAVALAAGHRPCGLCRRTEYLEYREAVRAGIGGGEMVSASHLNRRLGAERLHRGRGLVRGGDRKLWVSPGAELPDGAVIIVDGAPRLLHGELCWRFDFEGWSDPRPRPAADVEVLTPPTSVMALANGYRPALHPSVASSVG